MTTIQKREDIEDLVQAFYGKATRDPLIGLYFTKIIPIDWDEHIRIIVSFWENILFNTGAYKGGMLYKHFNLNDLAPFETKHFDRWLALWEETVDEKFEGILAEEVKFRAKSIAVIMQTKIGVYREQGNNQ